MKKTTSIFICLLTFLILSRFTQAAVIRPVQLQNVTTNSADVIWKTDTGGTSQVKYGLTSNYELGTANGIAGRRQIDGSPGFMHKATISGLSANTKYFYQVLTNGSALSPAGDQTFYIKTAPPNGSTTPFSWVVLGDPGNGGANQKAVASQVVNKKPDLAFVAGDVTYGAGGYGGFASLTGEPEQDSKHYDIYAQSMKFSPYYLACGNHDNNSNNTPAGIKNGCDIMVDDQSMPGGGRSGGAPVSYSFNHGNTHFTIINANPSAGTTSGSPQLNWALNDIRSSGQAWKVVIWHQNGWSSGTHSTNNGVVTGLIPMVQDAGANVVIWGHSHVYERFSRFAQQGKAGCTAAGGCKDRGPYYFTMGNSGSGGATGACGGYTNGPDCLARSGLGSVPTGVGMLYAQTNGNSLTFSYVTSSGATVDTVTYTTSGSSVTQPPAASPTRTPTLAPNVPSPTRTRTPIPGSATATRVPTQPPGGGVCTYFKN